MHAVPLSVVPDRQTYELADAVPVEKQLNIPMCGGLLQLRGGLLGCRRRLLIDRYDHVSGLDTQWTRRAVGRLKQIDLIPGKGQFR